MSDSEDDREEGRVDARGAVMTTSDREGAKSSRILVLVFGLGLLVRWTVLLTWRS